MTRRIRRLRCVRAAWRGVLIDRCDAEEDGGGVGVVGGEADRGERFIGVGVGDAEEAEGGGEAGGGLAGVGDVGGGGGAGVGEGAGLLAVVQGDGGGGAVGVDQLVPPYYFAGLGGEGGGLEEVEFADARGEGDLRVTVLGWGLSPAGGEGRRRGRRRGRSRRRSRRGGWICAGRRAGW